MWFPLLGVFFLKERKVKYWEFPLILGWCLYQGVFWTLVILIPLIFVDV